VPGPGQYENDKVIQAISLKSKSREFQFFGSSLERFKMKEANNLGPGSYQLNNSFDELHKKKNYVNYSFMSTIKESERTETTPIPGPG